jgi:hypothetical protein
MNNIITALNLTEGAVLTLEKMPDRLEFEALAVMLGQGTGEKGVCAIKIECTVCPDCSSLCTICLTDCSSYGLACPNKAQP